MSRLAKYLRNWAEWLDPTPAKKHTLSASIVETETPHGKSYDVVYGLTRDMSPELVGKLIMRMAIMTDSAQLLQKLTENGYVDAFYRLQLTTNSALHALFDEATLPETAPQQQQEAPKVEEVKAEQNVSVEEKPVIEALVGG